MAPVERGRVEGFLELAWEDEDGGTSGGGHGRLGEDWDSNNPRLLLDNQGAVGEELLDAREGEDGGARGGEEAKRRHDRLDG